MYQRRLVVLKCGTAYLCPAKGSGDYLRLYHFHVLVDVVGEFVSVIYYEGHSSGGT